MRPSATGCTPSGCCSPMISWAGRPMRERGSVQVEEYREDGLYLEGIVKTEDLHCFEGYLC